MAEYTIELRHVVENHNIFDFRYEFYDEHKKREFEEKFIRHFYFREIGHPSIDRFKLYLEDKMKTVFPYYNELFNAASIEYSILNNYNLTEEFTTTRENKGKSLGISSTVGQTFGDTETNSQQNRTVDTTGNVDTTGKDTEKETSVTDGNTSTDTKQKVDRKRLDTPQGLTDLTDSKYLTELQQDDSDTNVEGTSHSETERNAEKSSSVMQDSEGSEVTDDKVVATTHDEQKTTQDNNSKTFMDSKQTETHKLTRVGNIGVDTDSDMIEKHIRLQKTLRQIELLFFNECEDLFMLVY